MHHVMDDSMQQNDRIHAIVYFIPSISVMLLQRENPMSVTFHYIKVEQSLVHKLLCCNVY